MTLYHGSFLEIAKPDLVHSRPNVDFGRGFYVTPLYEQAAKWCGKFKRRGKDGIISVSYTHLDDGGPAVRLSGGDGGGAVRACFEGSFGRG